MNRGAGTRPLWHVHIILYIRGAITTKDPLLSMTHDVVIRRSDTQAHYYIDYRLWPY